MLIDQLVDVVLSSDDAHVLDEARVVDVLTQSAWTFGSTTVEAERIKAPGI